MFGQKFEFVVKSQNCAKKQNVWSKLIFCRIKYLDEKLLVKNLCHAKKQTFTPKKQIFLSIKYSFFQNYNIWST